MNEIKELEETLEVLYSKRSTLRKFLDHEGWKLVQDAIKSQIITRRQELLTAPINSLDAMILLASKRGELQGMELVSASFLLTLEDYDHDIEVLSEQLKELSNESKASDNPAD